MGGCVTCASIVISHLSQPSGSLMQAAMRRLDQGLRPHTTMQYVRQFKVFMAFVLYTKIESLDSVQTILLFIELLVMNYMSALKHMFNRYGWSCASFSHPLVLRLLKGVNYSVTSNPKPKGVFTLSQIREISSLCDLFESSVTYRAAFLVAFYGLFRISNIATHSARLFDKTRHLLRHDIRFDYPGVHIILKSAKNVQVPQKIHIVKLPEVRDPLLCPVQTLRCLLSKKRLPQCEPLFVLDDFSLLTQSLLRKHLATFVRALGFPLLYPQTKVGDILDSGPLRRRRRRNFLVDAITQKRINIFFSNLVHMLRMPKGRSLF